MSIVNLWDTWFLGLRSDGWGLRVDHFHGEILTINRDFERKAEGVGDSNSQTRTGKGAWARVYLYRGKVGRLEAETGHRILNEEKDILIPW